MTEINCRPCSDMENNAVLEIPDNCVGCKRLLIFDCEAFCKDDNELTPISEIDDCEEWEE